MIKSILCYIGTALFFLLGIGTMIEASDGGGYRYVGGDAYNILATYSYALCFFLIACVFAILAVGLHVVFRMQNSTHSLGNAQPRNVAKRTYNRELNDRY